jgi:F-type H+-transporting ATPase subunit delta
MVLSQLDMAKVASRYAKALLESAIAENTWDLVQENLGQLQRLALDVPELNAFLASPVLPVSDKQAVLAQYVQTAVSPMVWKLLNILLENNRIALLPQVIESAQAMMQERNGITQADVTVPAAISPSLEAQFVKALETQFGYRQVLLNVTVDPDILAGAIVKIGDKLIDGSYYGKLEMLRRQVGSLQ